MHKPIVGIHREGELIAHLLGTNASMRVTGSARKVRVGGSPGMITPLSTESPYGGTEVDNLVTVSRPEGLFYMVFLAPQESWPQLQSVFDRMIASIRFR